MSFEDNRRQDRRRKPDQSGEAASSRPARRNTANSEIGSALKNAYQRAVDEDIPAEMLDLLGKLG